MPSSSEYLRNKFSDFGNGNDGIQTCENIITKNGGSITREYMIDVTDAQWAAGDQDLWDAVMFLIHEWDYGMLE